MNSWSLPEWTVAVSHRLRRRGVGVVLACALLPATLTAQVEATSAGPHAVVVERDIMVPMQDGVRLAGDVYRPKESTGPVPVVLIRLPYNKSTHRRSIEAARFFASHGYAVVIQDVRGKNASEGEFGIFAGEPDDAYDTISWAATQPWSNGKVGTYGCSYMGEVQILVAARRHPRHVAMIPQGAGGAAGSAAGRFNYFGLLEGGAFALSSGFDWMSTNAARRLESGSRAPLRRSELLETLPVVDLMSQAGLESAEWQRFLTRDLGDPWWSEAGFIDADARFDIPALHVSSWYDYGVAEALTLFDLMRRNATSPRARDNQFMIISPTGHCRSEEVSEHTVVGERDYGDARLDFQGLYLRWFDYWLKGTRNKILSLPKVLVYVMGRGVWQSAAEWPLPETRYTPYYLHSGGAAKAAAGGGLLDTVEPRDEPPDRYVYDPADPTPGLERGDCADQRQLASRADVLVYTSPPLGRALEIIGPLKAVLFASSSAKDTDFIVKLLDVEPSGAVYNIQQGVLRSRYREGFGKAVWMRSGDVARLEIDLHATAYHFKPGHRIRVEVSSSAFPTFDRNLNTGGSNAEAGEWVTAINTVHHSAEHPSHLLLPVIP